MKFEELNLNQKILQALNDMGFTQPTPIQEQAVPLLMQGEDIIGQAQTGTGKTAAFSLPALEFCLAAGQLQRPREGGARPIVLILAPTRELAVQISAEIEKMSAFTSIKSVTVYGGQDIERQLRAFSQNPQIIVGTPGRLLDHIERGSLNLSEVKFVVLDEADRMLDMGFIDDVARIMGRTRPDRQSALFSATMPREVMNIAYEYMKSPQILKVSEDKITVDEITQKYLVVEGRNRIGYLLALLKGGSLGLMLVFVRTKMGAKKLADILHRKGFSTDSLHGDMRQSARDRAMKNFREGKTKVLIATDLASRGLDVSGVTHVVNYDLPEEPMTYIHRIGRTGRIGNNGYALSFVFEDQMQFISDVVQVTKVPIEPIHLEPISLPSIAKPREDFSQARGRGGFRGGGRGDRRGMRERAPAKPAKPFVKTKGGGKYHGRQR